MTRTLQIETPVGPVMITATDKAITSIRFGTETPENSTSTADPASAPLLQEAARQLREYFSGTRRDFTLPLAPRGDALPAEGLGSTAHHPLRRDPHLQGDRHPDRPQPVVPGRGHGQQPQSDRGRGPLPPGHRLRRQAHGICRGPRRQGAVARIGKTVVNNPDVTPAAPAPRKHSWSVPRSESSH